MPSNLNKISTSNNPKPPQKEYAINKKTAIHRMKSDVNNEMKKIKLESTVQQEKKR